MQTHPNRPNRRSARRRREDEERGIHFEEFRQVLRSVTGPDPEDEWIERFFKEVRRKREKSRYKRQAVYDTTRSVRFGATQHTIRYDTIHFDTIRNNGIWYNIIWYDTIRYRLIWYNTERYDTKRCDATRFNTNLSVPIVQYDTIWYDALWNEVITNMNWLINLSRRETERHYTNMTANSTTTPKANTFQGSTK